MKTIQINRTETAFFLPVADMLAVSNAVSTEEARYYLNGLFVEKSDSTGATITATDGHVLMSAALPDSAHVGAGCFTQAANDTGGFILRTDFAEKAFKAKTVGELWAYGDVETGILQFVDTAAKNDGEPLARVGVCEFQRIDGTFPDWRRVLPADNSDKATGHFAFCPSKLAQFKKASDAYKRHGRGTSDAVRFETGAESDPIRIKLARAGHFTGVLMPIRWANAA